mgnify:CR=1 FL=1
MEHNIQQSLFFDIERVLLAKKPKAFLLENVKQLKGHDKGNTLKVILEHLKNAGYKTYVQVLAAKDFGVPQNRERIYIVGFLDNNVDFHFPEPIKKETKVGSILEKNPDKKYVVTFNEIDAMVAPADKVADKTAGTRWVSILEERSVFLNYLEILKEKAPNVTVIGTTNISPKNNGLDRAAMSRFQNLVEVPYPDKECLYEALKMNLDTIKNKDKFISENDTQLKDLAQKMADRKFSFRNLEYIVNDAKGYHLDDSVSGKKNDFKFEYLKKAEQNDVLILATSLPAYDVIGKLYELGIRNVK